MIASSVFVLTALTLTGIYMKSVNQESQDDGYTLDFTALENNVDDKVQEIARNNQEDDDLGILNPFGGNMHEIFYPDDGLDLEPMEEAGSGLVEIPGLTDGVKIQEEVPSQGEIELPRETVAPPAATQKPAAAEEPKPSDKSEKSEKSQPEKEQQEKVKPTEGTVVAKTLNFTENEGLLRPVSGEILMPYSMDRSIYFSTMRDYRYNPALVLEAEKGTGISACASGRVINVFSNEEIGHAITMDLGNGYQITYGQLEGINVTLNSYVDKGDLIASVAAPTKYYCVEGSNLYLKMTRNGEPVDPEPLFR